MNNKIVKKNHPHQVFLVGGSDVLSGQIDNLLYRVFDKFGARKIKVLYVPIALFNDQKKVSTMSGYVKKLEKYMQNLCNNVQFNSINNKFSDLDISKEILSADVVFLSGGDTKYLIKRLSEKVIRESLVNAYKNGSIIVGNSAGAIALCKIGASLDNGIFKKYHGIGLIDKHIPVVHFHEDKNSDLEQFKVQFKNSNIIYLNEDDSCVVTDNSDLSELK